MVKAIRTWGFDLGRNLDVNPVRAFDHHTVRAHSEMSTDDAGADRPG